jgi:chloride channel protein, CIC family
MHDSIMTEKLTRRGLRVQSSYEVDRFRTVPVRDIMTTAVDTMPDTATVVDARRRFSAGGHSAYPLVARDGRCVAIVTRGDVLGEDAPDDAPLRDYATKDLVSVGPDDLAVTALERMVDEDVEHVPVLVADRLVGICTRTDLFRVRAMQFEAERHQTGWRGAWSWRNRNGGAVVPADDDVGGAH